MILGVVLVFDDCAVGERHNVRDAHVNANDFVGALRHFAIVIRHNNQEPLVVLMRDGDLLDAPFDYTMLAEAYCTICTGD